MFKSSLTVFFLILFAHSCNANSLIEEVEIEIPGENREERSVVETKGAVDVPDEDNIFGDQTNVGEKDFEVDEGHLKEEGRNSYFLAYCTLRNETKRNRCETKPLRNETKRNQISNAVLH